MKLNPIKLGGLFFVYKEKNRLENHSDITELDKKIRRILIKNYDLLKKNNLKNDGKLKEVVIKKNEMTYFFLKNGRLQYRAFSLGQENLEKEFNEIKVDKLTIALDVAGEKILNSLKKSSVRKANLYFYSSGGGGHKSAKESQMERSFETLMEQVTGELIEEKVTLHVSGDPFELKESEINELNELLDDPRLKDPAEFGKWCTENGFFKDVDILHNFLGTIGEWASSQWDEAQKAGDVKTQESLASKQWLSDLFFGPVIFIQTLNLLINFKPTSIVSTQAMATPSILLALKCYNAFFRPKEDELVKLKLYMTDLPSEHAEHFFSSLRRAKYYGVKELIQLCVPDRKGFNWEEACGLDESQIQKLKIEDLPVRPAFLKAVGSYKKDNNRPKVEIKVGKGIEDQLLREAIVHQCGEKQTSISENDNGKLSYEMGADDEKMFIMLGSQPTKSAIEEYINRYLEQARANQNKQTHLFIFSGKFEENK